MFDFEVGKGLRSAMRLTPNNAREFTRPPLLCSGPYLSGMLEVFEGAAKAGADFLPKELVEMMLLTLEGKFLPAEYGP